MKIATSLTPSAAAMVAALLPLSGCTQSVSPSFTVFGALFPAWLVCALIGVIAAIIARVLLVSLKQAQWLPYPLLVCTSIGLIVALLVWLLWFGS